MWFALRDSQFASCEKKQVMEAMKMMVVFMVVAVAFSAIGQAAAATVEAPAPSPTSDAAMFVPALFASVVALASGLLF
ncbi:hypothetical protein HID58_091289 [Brassica napus]|uniref:Uncharacterized protein n=2 Tax=Brassica napus TaxID=3708 RepID=A0ABQ7X2R1_BRANA|nr:hypothetical protein HID58_091289 [Brassica napus]